MNPPDKSKPKWTAPCLFGDLARSTKAETFCIFYQREGPVDACGRDCQAYQPWKGNA